MCRFLRVFSLLSIFLISSVRAASPDAIDAAIKKGADYLYSQQKNGNWETSPKRVPTSLPYDYKIGGQWGGRTALITYALLAADQSPQDDRIVAAVSWLRHADLVGTYAIALRAQVWNSLPKTPENKASLERDSKMLLDLCKTNGAAKGFYTYINSPDTKTNYDHSSSQYGVLGCWACADNLDSFPPGYWTVVDHAWRGDQHDDGTWSYHKEPEEEYPSNLPMTCAGLATLYVAQDFLNRAKPAEANGNPVDPAIAKSLKWVTDNVRDVFDSTKSRDPYYTLYGIERIGLAAGYKYFGSTNWYSMGTDYLVSKQVRTSGAFRSGHYTEEVSTAYALLFLSRGREPITMNKLQYDVKDKEGFWNQRPRDVANLTRYIGKQSERELQWQIVNLKAPVEELHDAPILYIAGNQELTFDTAQKDKLREFVQQGGLILAQADSGGLRFAKSARVLGSDLFPQYEFRPIGQDHAIFTQELFPFAKFKRKPNVLGLSNGARELMLVLPDDPARSWQPMDVRGHADDFQLGADIFLYSVDKKNLQRKGETYLVTADPKIKSTGSLMLARLQYDGNWDPEPGGWKRMAAIMLNSHHVDLKIDAVRLGAGKLADHKVAHLTGTTTFKLDDASRKELKDFVDAGGTLIVDSCGGNASFAESAETELETIFGDDAKALSEPLGQDVTFYRVGSKPIDIAWRTFAKAQVGSLKGGRLRGITIKNRIAVIYSPEDLSVGIVGQPVDGINGYEPKTATSLMENMLMIALKGK
jgi:hypothetical protein